MERCFFFSVLSVLDEFWTTELLSPKTLAGPFRGIPIIRSLNQRPWIFSEAIRIATNSDPKDEVSTVFCFFEYQSIGALLR